MTKRKWLTTEVEDLVSFKEASEILGVSPAQLNRWMQAGSGSQLDFGGFGPDRTYMCSWKELALGPVWVRADVERHRDEIGRQRAPATRKPGDQR